MQTDQDIIIQFQSSIQREQAFTQLVKKHQSKVYYQIKKMVTEHANADDIAQTVWIKIWNKLDGFKMESEFTTWLFRIAYNETVNFINKEKKFNGHMDIDDQNQSNSSQSTNGDPQSAKIQIKLEHAIIQLPEKQRVVFMLRYYEEFNYEKIASITGTTVGGAKANYHQAVKKMQELLKQD
jgi:RNA polymerase sigma factor (sigma-70 family)